MNRPPNKRRGAAPKVASTPRKAVSSKSFVQSMQKEENRPVIINSIKYSRVSGTTNAPDRYYQYGIHG